jgi:hypothetical protein
MKQIFNKSVIQVVSTYCKINNIEDVDGFIKKCFDTGFNIEKYGLLGKTLNGDEKDLKTGIVGEKQVEIEVIREIRVEVPVEIIKEVEVIKEVIIEKEIIKEVPVEKVVTKVEYISDKSGENELFEKIKYLENEMSKKNIELDEVRHSLDQKLDNSNEKMLQETLQKLRKELTEKNEKIKELIKINNDLENISKTGKSAVFLRGSNLNDTI